MADNPPVIGDLIGMRLSIVRRAAAMLVLHFGEISPHRSGKGTVGQLALHIQCPWRLDSPNETVTGKEDLHEPFPGHPGQAGQSGSNLQDAIFDRIFGAHDKVLGWSVPKSQFTVSSAEVSAFGDIRLIFEGGYAWLAFLASLNGESWRLFAPGSDAAHLVFREETD